MLNDPVRYIYFFSYSIFLFHTKKDIDIFFLFFVTRTYNVKNNESVQRMIKHRTKAIHTHVIIIIIIISYFFFSTILKYE